MKQMQQYSDLIGRILSHGQEQYNERTGHTCLMLIGEQLKFDLRDSCPAMTSRKLPVINTIGELLGFFRGCTNQSQFRALGCSYWDANASQTKSWLDNPFRKGEGDLGEIYGANWTAWQAVRLLRRDARTTSKDNFLMDRGWSTVAHTFIDSKEYDVIVKVVNQLETALRTILTDPTDRRILVNAWNFGSLDFQCLPPCHTEYVFTPMTRDKTLHLTMRLRSNDVYLGLPSNIFSASVFLSVMARLSGYEPATLTVQIANTHLYDNQLESAKELIEREVLDEPTLVISQAVSRIEHLSQVKGVFTRIEPSDISLKDYNHLGPMRNSPSMVA